MKGILTDGNYPELLATVRAGNVDVATPWQSSERDLCLEGKVYRSAVYGLRTEAKSAGDDVTAQLATSLLQEIDSIQTGGRFYEHYYTTPVTPELSTHKRNDGTSEVTVRSARNTCVLTGEDVAKTLARINKANTELPDDTVILRISTEDRDRANDVMEMAGANIKWFLENPVVLWCHNSWSPPIARCDNITIGYEKGKGFMDAVTRFNMNNAFSVDILNMYKDGFMSQSSIGFTPRAWTDEVVESLNDDMPASMWSLWGPITIRTYTSWDLVEYSACPIGMNAGTMTVQRTIDEMLQRAVAKGTVSSESAVIKAIADTYGIDMKVHVPGVRQDNEVMRQVSKLATDIAGLSKDLAGIKSIVDAAASKEGRMSEKQAATTQGAEVETKTTEAGAEKTAEAEEQKKGAKHSKETKDAITNAVKGAKEISKSARSMAKELNKLIDDAEEVIDEAEDDDEEKTATLDDVMALLKGLDKRVGTLETSKSAEAPATSSTAEEAPVATPAAATSATQANATQGSATPEQVEGEEEDGAEEKSVVLIDGSDYSAIEKFLK